MNKLQTLSTIAHQARDKGLRREIIQTVMDLNLVDEHYDVDWAAMAADNGSNMLHDVVGIAHHLDRKTGKLKDCFLPRFAR